MSCPEKRRCRSVWRVRKTAAYRRIYRIEGYHRDDRNTFEHPDLVRPDAAEAEFDSPIFEVDIKPESLCILRLCRRQNPVLPGLYADPDMLKYQDTYYLYPTTDGFANWSGTQFHAFSSRDMREWKDEGVILDACLGAGSMVGRLSMGPGCPFERDGLFLLLFLREKAGWSILYRMLR